MVKCEEVHAFPYITGCFVFVFYLHFLNNLHFYLWTQGGGERWKNDSVACVGGLQAFYQSIGFVV